MSTSVCNWIGVTCGVRHHRVTALDISYFGLTGTIPPQLGNLSFLAFVAINNNSFHGFLPGELAHLHRLRYINFNHNQLSGIVPSVFNISSLRELRLGHNQLTSFVNLSGGGSNLMLLDLSENMFEGEIPAFILECKQLQFLNLSFNNFRGGIPKEMGNLTMLKILSIGQNKLQGEIPKELGNLAELEKLSLPYNVLLTGKIHSLIFNISSLWYINYTNNSLTGDLPDKMCSHHNHPALETLALSSNQITGTIPYNLWQCKKLTVFSVSYNQLTGFIPRDIGNLTLLRALAIGGNNLTGDIPYGIGNLRNIEIMGLEDNYLVGHVPATIFNISTLRRLALGNNTLSGSLSSSFGTFGIPNAELLDFGINNFSGIFPNFITGASKLYYLEMGGNSFSGFIPNTIGNNLTSLEWLGFSGNHFTSATPNLSFLTSLTNCKNLRVVGLAGNPLNGFLPSSIGNLSTSLELLSMSNCNISGSIPYEFGKLKNLVTLYLSSNELTGSIPVTLGNMQELQGLFLGYNKLEGSIPDELCHLDNLAELYLDSNKLFGAIPACFGHLTSLRILMLGSNGLTFVIPSSLWNLKDILHFNLSSNSLVGTLPLEFGNLKVVIDVDLSRNHLTGGIPTTIGGLQNLQSLSLSYNGLQGPIPESFGGLIGLESLDLSNNNLSGVIPKSMEALSYLKHLNLSFNQFEGKIPTQGPFANFSFSSFMMNYALCGLPQQHVPPCKTSIHPKSRIIVILAIALPLTIVVLLTLIIIVLIRCRTRRSIPPNNNDADHVSQGAIWRRISYQELVQATCEFSESNLLGKGSFGSVFKGRLLDGMEIAVKVFNIQMDRALRSFDVECELLSGIRHRNLIKIISSCTNNDLKALVLEYMPNGSLAGCLYSQEHFLDILQRLNIMIDVASALEYLHFGYSIPVVHCDVKPSNVLLDQSMVAHLSDFGIAKLLGEEESMAQTQTLATIGYMAPEYGREGKVSQKGDVYSYGIMLMETFTKKKPTDEIFTGEMDLRRWVGDSLNRSVMEVLDNDLLQMEDEHFLIKEQCVSSILSLAMDCTTYLHEDRINIRNVVNRLIKIRATFSFSTRGNHVRIRRSR
ncbi:hypothetical protein LWI29_023683 [Acer saccharum]|uniref:non-specific serine/threonine protein kinase n=1 Tax=Acer saccharum TaxID=4024 RepID=A0AA39W090_ACESA|nr:hypothetical protein LWI29_023683 [Acer saccharum]